MEHHFLILGVELGLAGPAAVIDPIARAYRRFAIDPPASAPGRLRLELRESAGAVRIGERLVPLVPGIDPGVQLYQQFQRALMNAVEGLAVLHAAALVDPAGRAVVIGAPSGHGKSSLALELACRGFAFMSDDYAPLDLERRWVLPCPRAVGIRPAAETPIPDAFRQALDAPSGEKLFDKKLVDVGEVLGESALARGPAALGHVLLLSSLEPGSPEPATVVRLATRSAEAGALHDLFARTAGVTILTRHDGPGFSAWSIRLDRSQRPTAAIAAALDGDGVVQIENRWESRPDFTARPRAVRVPRREAALFLAREMLNRGVRSRLLASHAGDGAALFVSLAGALRDAACWKVQTGNLMETVSLIEGIVSYSVPSAGDSDEVDAAWGDSMSIGGEVSRS